MAKTRKDLENELDKIENKLNTLTKDFVRIKKNAKTLVKQAYTKKDNKKIVDIKKKILSL